MTANCWRIKFGGLSACLSQERFHKEADSDALKMPIQPFVRNGRQRNSEDGPPIDGFAQKFLSTYNLLRQQQLSASWDYGLALLFFVKPHLAQLRKRLPNN